MSEIVRCFCSDLHLASSDVYGFSVARLVVNVSVLLFFLSFSFPIYLRKSVILPTSSFSRSFIEDEKLSQFLKLWADLL